MLNFMDKLDIHTQTCQQTYNMQIKEFLRLLFLLLLLLKLNEDSHESLLIYLQ
jgi:hypothetical protein